MAPDSEPPRKKKRRESSVTRPTPHNDSPASLLSTDRTDTTREKMMKSFTERDEALRAIITCKICFRPLYEPFTNHCGHTYCYGCLCQWFSNGSRRKTCPDCRTVITEAPAPAYALREITREILQRPELLPSEESHELIRQEEAAAVEKDRSNLDPNTGGLFRGCFRRVTRKPRPGPLRDFEDGVVRCPECAWELEGSRASCNNCGYELESDEGTSYDGDDTSEAEGMNGDIDSDEGHDGDQDSDGQGYIDYLFQDADDDSGSISASSTTPSVPGREHPTYAAGLRNDRDVILLDSGSEDGSETSVGNAYGHYGANMEDSEESDDAESSINDFVVDDDVGGDEEADESQSSDSTTRNLPNRRRPIHTIIDSEDEEESEIAHGRDDSDKSSISSRSISRSLPFAGASSSFSRAFSSPDVASSGSKSTSPVNPYASTDDESSVI